MAGVERLRQLLMETLERRPGVSLRDLADEAGLSPATLSHIMTGKVRRPSTDTLGRLAPVLGVTYDQLLDLLKYRDIKQKPPSREELLEQLAAVDATEVPIYDVTASASPSRLFLNEAPVEYAYLPERRRYGRGRIKGITVRGDCLAPHVQDGDQVFIDTQAEYADGDLVLAVVGDALHLKQLRASVSGWLLVTTNGEPPIVVDDNVVLLGKYIGLWRPGL